MSLPAPVHDGDSVDPIAEVGGDLHRSLGHHLDWVVREWRGLLAEVERKQHG